jgi:hypothetical protein
MSVLQGEHGERHPRTLSSHVLKVNMGRDIQEHYLPMSFLISNATKHFYGISEILSSVTRKAVSVTII